MNPKSLKNGRRSVGSSGALVRGVSIHNPVTGGECASSTPSLLINYSPLGQWLAFLLPPYCLSHQKPKPSSRHQHESAKKRTPRAALHYMGWWQTVPTPLSRVTPLPG